ncbi:MAG: methyltransferase [Balneola sp.]|jgi:23S rRNA (guanine1835-N2)-methyltransferase
MKYTYNDRDFDIKRYPPTTNRSLQPWNAADELILEYISDNNLELESSVLINDRFGFLATTLFKLQPISIVNHKSHQKAIERNFVSNSLVLKSRTIKSPLGTLSDIDLGVIKIPKSLEAFEFYLQKLQRPLKENGVIVCGFMTKYFTPQLLEISSKYFEDIQQSKAKKKARLLILKNKKDIKHQEFKVDIEFNDKVYKQYPGVFSSDHIDYATQFLLEHLTVKESENTFLDLASGNGVIADYIINQQPNSEVHLVDDSYLAVESSKMNVSESAHFHWNDSLEDFEDLSFDLATSNPPFHFEHENNIEVSHSLFEQVQRCLKESGRFVLVANKHLNYKTHLDTLFKTCSITAENDKFVVYECLK